MLVSATATALGWTEVCRFSHYAGDPEPARSGSLLLKVPCPSTTYTVEVTLTDEQGHRTSYGSAPYEPGVHYLWPDAHARTAPLPIMVDWSIATRATRAPLDWDSRVEESQYADGDLADVVQGVIIRPYRHTELHSSFGGLRACGNITDYDYATDGPVRIDAGPAMVVDASSAVWYWSACNFIGGARGGPIPLTTGNPISVHARSDPVNTLQFLGDETHVLLGSAPCYWKGGCQVAGAPNGRLTTRFVLSARPADPRYAADLG